MSQDRTQSPHPVPLLITLKLLQASTNNFGNLTAFFHLKTNFIKSVLLPHDNVNVTSLINVIHFEYPHCNGGGVKRKILKIVVFLFFCFNLIGLLIISSLMTRIPNIFVEIMPFFYPTPTTLLLKSYLTLHYLNENM